MTCWIICPICRRGYPEGNNSRSFHSAREHKGSLKPIKRRGRKVA